MGGAGELDDVAAVEDQGGVGGHFADLDLAAVGQADVIGVESQNDLVSGALDPGAERVAESEMAFGRRSDPQ